MPYTDFHYTPTGTGVISGKEVLEQTEDAINDLGTQISGDVQTAIDTANNALNVANTASTDAQNAVNTANTAYTTATNAQNTANAAQNTASNALTAAQNAQNDVNALGNRVTTAENNITQNTTDISGLTTRMGTAEGNITTLQNDVITAQGTATSAQNTATMARQQAYVFRYSSTALTPSSTNSNTLLDNTDNLKVGDKVIDSDGVLFSITAIDSQNSTFTIGTALVDLAQDSDVVHTSGNETVNGIKSFTSIINMIPNGIGTYGCVIKVPFSRGDTENTEGSVLTSTNHATFRVIDKGSNIISETCTENYVDGKVAQILNVRNTDDNGNQVQSSISHLLDKNAEQDWLYPTINNKVMLGTSTYKWKSVYATNYYYGASNTEFSDKFVTTDTVQTVDGKKQLNAYLTLNGSQMNNEFSNNARTCAYLTANRDTVGKSGVFVSKFRQNRAQGSMSGTDTVQVTFDVLENSVRSNRLWYLNWLDWENDAPKTVEVRSFCEKVDYKLTHINALNPGALSLPNLSSGLDISGYITVPNTHNTYTPPVDGWLSVILKSTSGPLAMFIYQGDLSSANYSATSLPNETEPCVMCSLPVVKDVAVSIDVKGTNAYVVSAKFFPCQGNV